MDNMTKLAVLLTKADIPFELRGQISTLDTASVQICSPSVDNCLIDAICHQYSYGGNQGLLEILAVGLDDVVGWLSAEEAFEYFERIVQRQGE